MAARLISTGLLAAVVALAQQGGQGGHSRQANSDMPMERSEQTRMDRISAMLSLNKDQKKQIHGILDDAQKDAGPLRDELAKASSDLGDAAAGGKSGDDLKPALDAYAQAQSKMAVIEMQTFAKIYQALDKDQQLKSGPVFMMMAGIFRGKNWDTVPAR